LSISSVGFAQSIKERFKERLPQIIELKNEGIIGENNRGYLEFVGAKKKKENLIRAENRDRQLVYETIAKKENTSAEKVGKRRAIQLRGLASPGHWLQDENGNWYKK
jgi:uncharacterized protein YdbL (DUF1318 family)